MAFEDFDFDSSSRKSAITMGWNPFGGSSEAGPSNTGSSSSAATTAPDPPRPLDWDTVYRDELRNQEAQIPTVDDVPTCMSLFDSFFKCYALFPAVRGYYRYGYVRSCSHKWDDYKYCLSIKSEDAEERRRLWIKRVAEGWTKRRLEGSSEDVWEARRTPPENFPPPWPEDLGNEQVTT
ncbi:hypothetical protein BD324DRAFT_619194 [Kockovaella imperatae]|uniref:Early meiotic induction protein 1 n=1 Tax=Kockovaella imperatae TaxID=4999 RepID=A0A1Y1UMQ8_9TREE|nr:hypothetical protein BD324DRAFT_619194 [Kockovaella imperatae]ORX39299.1 hypothetical protein BD324DRAFT_619194 [Kockovaella imperatae]